MISITSRMKGFFVFAMTAWLRHAAILDLLPVPERRLQFFQVLNRFFLHVLHLAF